MQKKAETWLTDRDSEALLAWVMALESSHRGEVPVGALLRDRLGRFIAQAGNRTRCDLDCTAHAEMVVIRLGCQRVGNDRLAGGALMVTLKPCGMCRHALAHAHLSEVSYLIDQPDKKSYRTSFLHHTTFSIAEHIRAVIVSFFRKRRHLSRR
ncbi:deaminase [Magnetococcales bacterium HHB-1]